MEERVGQAVSSGKAEAQKAQEAGGSQVLRHACFVCSFGLPL